MSEKEYGLPERTMDECADAQERSPLPPGWNGLDEKPPEADEVEGLLSNGKVTHAEWWGPVPEELWGPNGEDGSGWAWDAAGSRNYGAGLSLVGWRPLVAARATGPASPQGNSGRNQ